MLETRVRPIAGETTGGEDIRSTGEIGDLFLAACGRANQKDSDLAWQPCLTVEEYVLLEQAFGLRRYLARITLDRTPNCYQCGNPGCPGGVDHEQWHTCLHIPGVHSSKDEWAELHTVCQGGIPERAVVEQLWAAARDASRLAAEAHRETKDRVLRSGLWWAGDGFHAYGHAPTWKTPC